MGETGLAIIDVDNEGTISVHREYWNTRLATHFPKDEKVRVIRVENLCLIVTLDVM